MPALSAVGLREWMPLLAVVALVAVVFIIKHGFARRRTAALTTFAMELGFNFEGEYWLDQSLAPASLISLFQKGRAKKFRNIMTGGAAGLRVSLFDYAFTRGYGRYSRTYSQTIAAFLKPGAGFPKFALQRRGAWQKIWDTIVRRSVRFEGHPEFSRRWQLKSPEDEKIKALFTPALLAYCEGLEAGRSWRVEGLDDSLIIYRLGKKTKPQDFRAFLDETTGMANSFFTLCGLKKAAF